MVLNAEEKSKKNITLTDLPNLVRSRQMRIHKF